MGFNSTEFAWKDIKAAAMGRSFERITEVSYDIEVEKKPIYGRGSKTRGIQTGNEKVTGSLTIGQSELEAMTRTAQSTNANAKVTDVSFDLQVHYLNGTDLVMDRIVGCEFTKIPKSMKQGDTEMEVKLDFIAMDVLYNI